MKLNTLLPLLSVLITTTLTANHVGYIANNGSDDVTVFDVASDSVRGTIDLGSTAPLNLNLSPDVHYVYVLNQNGGASTVSVIDTDNFDVIQTIPGFSFSSGAIPYVSFTSTSQTAYVTNSAGTTVVGINTATFATGTPITVGNTPRGIVVTPNDTTAYVACSVTGNVDIITLNGSGESGGEMKTGSISVGGNPEGLAITPNGAYLYVGDISGNSVSVISTASNTVVAGPIAVGNTPRGLAVSPNGNVVYVANQGSNDVSIISTASNTVIGTVSVGSTPFAVAFDSDGEFAYVANSASDTVSIIDTATEALDGSISTGTNPIAVVLEPPEDTSDSETAAVAAAVQQTASIQAQAFIETATTYNSLSLGTPAGVSGPVPTSTPSIIGGGDFSIGGSIGLGAFNAGCN